MKTVKIIICLFLVQGAFAQEVQQLPWQQRDRKDMKPLAYEYQREADVMWSKNIWRIIDVRQKLNAPFARPQEPLVKIIHEAAMKGEITVYDPAVLNADQFKQAMSVSDVRRTGTRVDTVMEINPVTLEEEQVVQKSELRWDRVIKYKVKEVWFFDTKTSTMKVRIIGLAPVIEDYDADGNYRGDMTMYWVYYPGIRDLLAKHGAYNPQNDMTMYSWEDLIEMRKFASYIYKESNVFDRNIQEYASGIDAQLESERIKQEIFEKEFDMWSY